MSHEYHEGEEVAHQVNSGARAGGNSRVPGGKKATSFLKSRKKKKKGRGTSDDQKREKHNKRE